MFSFSTCWFKSRGKRGRCYRMGEGERGDVVVTVEGGVKERKRIFIAPSSDTQTSCVANPDSGQGSRWPRPTRLVHISTLHVPNAMPNSPRFVAVDPNQRKKQRVNAPQCQTCFKSFGTQQELRDHIADYQASKVVTLQFIRWRAIIVGTPAIDRTSTWGPGTLASQTPKSRNRRSTDI